MAAVEQLHRRVRIIALERVRAGRRKERIVLAPHDEHRRLVRAQILLPFGEPLRIFAVVIEELELDRVVAGTVVLYFGADGGELTDTCHDSVDGAKRQAELEFGIAPDRWTAG